MLAPLLYADVKGTGTRFTTRLAYLKQQNGVCPICTKPLDAVDAVLDHSHTSGFIRGALHNRCNSIVVRDHEDPVLLARLIRYLGVEQAVLAELDGRGLGLDSRP